MIVSARGGEIRGRMGAAERAEYAKKMHEKEMTMALSNKDTVRKEARLFEERVSSERRRLGLS